MAETRKEEETRNGRREVVMGGVMGIGIY